LEEILTHNFLV